MASFHLTLEENGRYLTAATAVLLQQQIAPWVEIIDPIQKIKWLSPISI